MIEKAANNKYIIFNLTLGKCTVKSFIKKDKL